MYTINDLYEWSKKQVDKGNGNLKVQLSNDEEGNGYHGLYYGLEPLKEMETENRECIIDEMEDVNGKNWKEYAILG